MREGATDDSCLDVNAMAAYVTHCLEDSEVARADAHIAACVVCRKRLSELARVLTLDGSSAEDPGAETVLADRPRVLAPGTHVGRYIVEETLGAGGMGVVYAARDTQLERRVALKMVRGGAMDVAAGEERLLGEARAMAKLSHPNVVSIYDVVLFQGQLFLAMEIVEGISLRGWLLSDVRPWRKILATFVEAGRGLAAAHAAGIIHGDFKPANVLRGVAGRVCVTDFGLATSGDGESSESREPRRGTRAGTPAYMAPEHREGGKADARSDQYSFCVSLHEALFGQRPFAAPLEAESPATKGRSRHVPARIRKALERGLSPDPSRRHPTMEALLSALTHDPRARRIQFGAALLVGLGCAVALLALRRVETERRRVCAEAGSRMALVWDDSRKKAVAQVFERVGTAYGRQAGFAVEGALDAYGKKWSSSRMQTCEVVLAHAGPPALATDPGTTCLEDRLRDVEAVIAELSTVRSSSSAANAVVAAETLEPVEACARSVGARAQPRPRTSEADQVSRGLAQVKALHHFGKYADAVALARGLRSAVDALDHGELSARFFLESSIAHRANRTIDEAEEDGYRAVSLADAAGDDVLRAKAWTNLLIVVGYFRSDEKQGARIYDQAMGVLTRTAGDPMLEADLRAAHAVVLSGRHKHAEMSAEGEKAVAVYERGPSSLSLADALRNLCIAESRLGRVDAARRHCEKALTVMREVAGDAHPMVGRILSNLASALLQARETDLALAAASRAVAIYEGASDTEGANIDFAVALMVLGETLLELERFGEALPVLERCLPLVDRKGAWQQVSFRVRTGLGQAHLGLEQPERAVPHLERVVTVSDVDAEYLADARFHLARALVSLSRDHERAMRLVEEAKALLAGKPALSPLQRKKGDAMQRWASARHAPAAHPSQTPSSVSRTAPAGMR